MDINNLQYYHIGDELKVKIDSVLQDKKFIFKETHKM